MQKSVKMGVTEVTLKMTEDELEMIREAVDHYLVNHYLSVATDSLEDWEALADSLDA